MEHSAIKRYQRQLVIVKLNKMSNEGVKNCYRIAPGGNTPGFRSVYLSGQHQDG